MLRHLAAAGTAALALAAGAATAPAATSAPPAPPQPRSVVVRYHDSGRWAADTRAALARARRDLLGGLRHLRHGRRPAIVLDIDDTSLTQYPCRRAGGLPFDDLAEGVRCVATGTLPAIAPTRSLYRLAQRRHVRVIFITGRAEQSRAVTVANLRRAGFRGRHGLVLRPASTFSDPSVVPYKSGARRALLRKGYEILVNVGDQRSDLAGGAADHRVKVPNPMYLIK